MKKILCFGDSNVFGFNPIDGSRYNEFERWSGILKNNLKNYIVIENGENNRTCFSKNYLKKLIGIEAIEENNLNNYEKIILSIGINDLQKHYNNTIKDFEIGLDSFINKIISINPKINIIILIPHIINENILKSPFKDLFDKNSIKMSEKLPEIYTKIGTQNGCILFDLNSIAKISTIDSLHFDKENHRKIANHLINFLE